MEGSTYSGDTDDVIIDLDDVARELDIPLNASYVLNGLDTINPVLIIDGSIYLIGKYEETIGECLVLHESDGSLMFHEETGPSEVNLFSGKCIVDSRQLPLKQIKPVARLEKILKFRLMTEAEKKEASDKNEQPAAPCE
ncbi:hypothetical protein Leryth_012041 [Lithospermum erythrorhizon]|nr:hypothetical protein Leryth_012041 [Lithospermum erythrorhizon]